MTTAKYFFSLAVALCLSNTAHAVSAVYGLPSAVNIKAYPCLQDCYIQVGSFAKHATAIRYQSHLQTQTTYPVRVLHRSDRYAVRIGPMQNAEERRDAALTLLKPSKSRLKQTSPLHTTQRIKDLVTTLFSPAVSSRQWFVSVGTGVQVPSGFNSQMSVNNGSGFPEPYDQDVYTTSSQQSALITVTAGRRWERSSLWLPAYSLGLFYQHQFPADAGGTVTQHSYPVFLNYNYRWHVTSNAILASAKANIYRWDKFLPYAMLGVGAGFAEASNYTESALSGVTPRNSPGFQGHVSSNVAYHAGAGLDIQLSRPFLLSVGYLYQNIGRIQSGPGLGTWSSESLNLGTYGSSQVLVNLSYLWDV